MQSYPINIAAGQAINVQISGDNFVYESGASTTSEKRIIVKPESGNEIVLRPGQQFRQTQNAGLFLIRAYDAAAVITGVVIIGSGEFFDSNTNNTVVLDGEFTNSVYVNNTAGQAIPVVASGTIEVANDAGNPLPVSGTVATTVAPMTYTHSINTIANTSIPSGVPITVVTPAENTNGVVINKFECLGASGTSHIIQVMAHTAVPTSMQDGAVIEAFYMTATASEHTAEPNIKIPAGKGVYIGSSDISNGITKSLLYTKL